MSKMRIYEYAREENISSKDVIEELEKMDIEVASHMSSIDLEQQIQLDEIFSPKKADKKEEAPKKKEKQEPAKKQDPAKKQSNKKQAKKAKAEKKEQPKQKETKEIGRASC